MIVIVSDVEHHESISQSFDISTNHLTEMTFSGGHQVADHGHWHWRHHHQPAVSPCSCHTYPAIWPEMAVEHMNTYHQHHIQNIASETVTVT